MSVSVVIPAHNASEFIEECIQSVLAQDWPTDEIIVINDGSTDRDYDDLARLASNIRVFNQLNRGVSAARNRGCALATSEYVAILDADDVWLPGKLRAQMMHLARHPTADAVFCLGMYWRPDPEMGRWVRPKPVAAPAIDVDAKTLHYRDFLYSIPVASSTLVVKRHVWQAIGGFDESMQYAEDQHFNLRMSRSYRVDLLNMVGMLYRQHSESATARLQKQNHWADVISGAVKSLGLVDAAGVRVDPTKLRRRLAKLHFSHGYDHFWRGSLAVARREFWRAFRRNPLASKTVGYLLVLAIPGMTTLVKHKRPSMARWFRIKQRSMARRVEGTREVPNDVETPRRG